MKSAYDNIDKTGSRQQLDLPINIAVVHNSPDTPDTGPAEDSTAVHRQTAENPTALHRQTAEKLFGCPTITGSDGKVYLQGHLSHDSLSAPPAVENLQGSVSNVPEVSDGIRKVQDLQELSTGIAAGLSDTAQETLDFLSRPNAVNNSLLSTACTASDTINYYATQPERVLPDVQIAVQHTEQVLVDTLGHPLPPEEIGELAGRTMPMFIAAIPGAKPLTAKQIESLGGVEKLAQMPTEELEQYGLTRDLTDISYEKPSSRTPRGPWPGKTTDESVRLKLDRYLLDPDHSRGGDKAKVLKDALGFSRENMIDLASQIQFDPDKALFQNDTYDGPKFIQKLYVTGINGKTKELPAVWIHNLDNVVRLVTIKKFPKRLG